MSLYFCILVFLITKQQWHLALPHITISMVTMLFLYASAVKWPRGYHLFVKHISRLPPCVTCVTAARVCACVRTGTCSESSAAAGRQTLRSTGLRAWSPPTGSTSSGRRARRRPTTSGSSTSAWPEPGANSGGAGGRDSVVWMCEASA